MSGSPVRPAGVDSLDLLRWVVPQPTSDHGDTGLGEHGRWAELGDPFRPYRVSSGAYSNGSAYATSPEAAFRCPDSDPVTASANLDNPHANASPANGPGSACTVCHTLGHDDACLHTYPRSQHTTDSVSDRHSNAGTHSGSHTITSANRNPRPNPNTGAYSYPESGPHSHRDDTPCSHGNANPNGDSQPKSNTLANPYAASHIYADSLPHSSANRHTNTCGDSGPCWWIWLRRGSGRCQFSAGGGVGQDQAHRPEPGSSDTGPPAILVVGRSRPDKGHWGEEVGRDKGSGTRMHLVLKNPDALLMQPVGRFDRSSGRGYTGLRLARQIYLPAMQVPDTVARSFAWDSMLAR